MRKKQKGIQNIMDKATRVFELPMASRADYSKIISIDDNDFYIENYKKLIKYTDSEICFSTAYNIVKFEGNNLFLRCFSSENMIIAGEVSSISYKGIDEK